MLGNGLSMAAEHAYGYVLQPLAGANQIKVCFDAMVQVGLHSLLDYHLSCNGYKSCVTSLCLVILFRPTTSQETPRDLCLKKHGPGGDSKDE